MTKPYPRRRDVRDMCERVFAVLGDQLNDTAEFGDGFLTAIRDLLRDGISFEYAVLAHSFENDVPEPDLLDLPDLPEAEVEAEVAAKSGSGNYPF